MLRSTCLFLMATFVLAGCATSSGQSKNTAPPQAKGEEIPALGQLSVKNLPAGSCGLLLWTIKNNEPRLIMRAVVGGDAMTVLDGVQTALYLNGVGGDQLYGVNAKQRFVGTVDNELGTEQITVGFTGEFGQKFQSGVYIEQGVVSITGEDGWERITPTAGIAGCRP